MVAAPGVLRTASAGHARFCVYHQGGRVARTKVARSPTKTGLVVSSLGFGDPALLRVPTRHDDIADERVPTTNSVSVDHFARVNRFALCGAIEKRRQVRTRGRDGKRYRRQDEIGTPFCVKVDVPTVGTAQRPKDAPVQIRARNTMQQMRVPISSLGATVEKLMDGKWSEVEKEAPSSPATL